MKRNYQLDMEAEIAAFDTKRTILLQSCCGPCSSYVLSCLLPHFDITVYYYNPNIFPESEYDKRLGTQMQIISALSDDIKLMPAQYDYALWCEHIKGLESEPEGGSRCECCFELRLDATARAAAAAGIEYFGTTLTVSPHKNAEKINSIGSEIAARHGVKWLPADFKKREGYKKSIELSKKYELYRQDYCGCEFSMRDEKE